MTLYSTNCPKCKVLEAKLSAAGYEFNIENDTEIMKQMGFSEAPILEVNDEYYNFSQAIAWLKSTMQNDTPCDSCQL